jgi:hypothetical protein
LHRNLEGIDLAHGVNEKRQAAAAICALAKRAIDLSGCHDGIGIGGAHPVHGPVNVGIGDSHAVTDHHCCILFRLSVVSG